MENGTGYWDRAAIARYADTHGSPEMLENDDPNNSAGRLIYPLLHWFQTTGDDRALALADRIASYVLTYAYTEDGAFSSRVGFHVHSITSTFSGVCDLALFHARQGEARFDVRRLETILFRAILPLSSEAGWCKELKDRPGMGGEVNCTGDIIQALLCLYRLSGKSDYLRRAEQMTRGHLLPSQVFPERLPASFLLPAGTDDDQHRDISLRLTGGFGFPTPEERAPLHYDAPFCRVTTLDITGGAVQALIRVLLCAVDRENGTFRVNLLLPTSFPGFCLTQPSLDTFCVCASCPVILRCPACAAVRIDGNPAAPAEWLPLPPGNHTLRFDFLPRVLTEDLFGNRYRTTMIGEQAVGTDHVARFSDMFDGFRS